MIDIYTINICVPTRDGDRYKRVAINEYPIIMIGLIEDVKKQLKQLKDYIYEMVPSDQLREQATFNIRRVDKEFYDVVDVVCNVNGIIE